MRKHICDLASPIDDPTKTRPQDRRGQHADKGGGQHAGLLLQRYLCRNATSEEGNPEEKRAILYAAINAATNQEVRDLYKGAFKRWRDSLPKGSMQVELATRENISRLIVGLGSESVLETGIRLHHTYGMPIIPGSALKGLAAHYCDHAWGERNNPNPSEEALNFRSARKENRKNDLAAEPPGKYHHLLFGSSDESGCIIFHDAWYVPDSSKKPLVLDVMTPHHPKWNDIDNPVAPTDFDSPIPVPFLSATGMFQVVVSWCGPIHADAMKWARLALDLLCDALCDWGAGGKTSSGYGRFDREKLEAAKKEREAQTARLQREHEEQARLAAMSPIERSIKAFLDSHPDKTAKDHMKLLKELEKTDGQFQTGEDRRAVAERIKIGMQSEKVWKDKEPHGKRKKFIEGILGDPS